MWPRIRAGRAVRANAFRERFVHESFRCDEPQLHDGRTLKKAGEVIEGNVVSVRRNPTLLTKGPFHSSWPVLARSESGFVDPRELGCDRLH